MKKICHCGSCEAATFRAVGILDKMLADDECTQYIVAVGIALSALGSDIMLKQLEGMLEDKGTPSFIATALATNIVQTRCNEISDMLQEWYNKNRDTKVTDRLNEVITRHNEAREAEKNLPKGD